ncbi:unnamed protein product [Bursaphelenchus xylophilus]|uniref:(pine wood nematode) hypothetical protein n=1 Tax=Bursaphelenchus xylophilus TaxID=6326 RepID=A0A1I7RSC5_BURXY|nr:unnamed protein product [Bursaphelenchus xylophilus]CAG9123050.1 unnamed protein product [Bursaphelenchus xylophilus]
MHRVHGLLLLLLIAGACFGVEYQFVKPGKLDHLIPHPVFKLSALSIKEEFYSSPEVTKEGFFRYDIKAAVATNKQGFYGLLKPNYKIKFNLDNCKNKPSEQISSPFCLCFTTDGNKPPDAEAVCGENKNDWSYVCLIKGNKVKYWNGEKIEESKEENCKSAVLSVNGDSMQIGCGTGSNDENVLTKTAPPPKITGEYIRGKPYKVQMINLYFNPCGSAEMNDLYYTQNFHLTAEPTAVQVSVPEDSSDESTCPECECKVDVPRFAIAGAPKFFGFYTPLLVVLVYFLFL